MSSMNTFEKKSEKDKKGYMRPSLRKVRGKGGVPPVTCQNALSQESLTPAEDPKIVTASLEVSLDLLYHHHP